MGRTRNGLGIRTASLEAEGRMREANRPKAGSSKVPVWARILSGILTTFIS